MSEICLDCYNKINGTHKKPNQVILTAPDDIGQCCECGEVGRLLMRVPSSTPWGWAQCKYWKIMDKLGG